MIRLDQPQLQQQQLQQADVTHVWLEVKCIHEVRLEAAVLGLKSSASL